MNHYVVLGVPRGADSDTIRSAFRALVRRYHPDAGEGSSADRFRQIVTAYETLNDPVRREQYDRDLRTQEARTVRFVEPLIAPIVAEPLLGPIRRSTPAGRQCEPTRVVRFEDVLEELFRNDWGDWFFRGF